MQIVGLCLACFAAGWVSLYAFIYFDRRSMPDYDSDITLGERYRDPQTGIAGTATAVCFFQYACERVTIETVVHGKIEEYNFDAPRLVSVATGERATTERTGGPGTPPARPSTPSRP